MHNTVLRLWLIVWVLTLPLVHIHPEADHAQGISHHIHGGTYHSILVNTPVHGHKGHAHEAHHHDGFFSPAGSSESDHASSHPPYDLQEATYGFAVIKPSLDTNSTSLNYFHDLMATAKAALSSNPRFSIQRFPPQITVFSILSDILSPRAPPVLSA